MDKPKRYGIAVEDLPEGALGMPENIFEYMIEYEDVYKQIMEQKDGSGDERGTKHCD